MNMNTSDQLRDYITQNRKEFGQTGWKIPPVSFGGAALSGEGGGYGFGHISKAESHELVSYALDLGINLFDTAPIYGFGLSEKRLGEFLKGKRDQVYIVTKSGVTWSSSKRVNMTNDPKVTDEMFLQSMKDLGTDYIDLYMIHWPDKNIDIRKPLEILVKYQMKGVIRKIGLCNSNLEDLTKAKELTRIDVLQSEYNLFNRNSELELFPYCQKNQCAFMSWGPLDKGALTGNYDLNRTYDNVDARKSAPWFKKSDLEKKVNLVNKMKKLLPPDKTMMQMINGFYLSEKNLSTILVGAKTPQKLHEYISSMMTGKEAWHNFKDKDHFLTMAKNWEM